MRRVIRVSEAEVAAQELAAKVARTAPEALEAEVAAVRVWRIAAIRFLNRVPRARLRTAPHVISVESRGSVTLVNA